MSRFINLVWILGGAVLIAAGCTKEPTETITFEKGQTPDEVFADFVTQETDSGLVRWKLTAPKASRFKEKQLVVLDRPTIVFYDQAGIVRTTLVSEAGEYSEARRDMLAYGHVVVTSVEGDVLETDSLVWDNTKKMIVSDSFVRLKRGSDVITGYGLECRDDLGTVDIKRNVKATVVDQEGEIAK